MEREDRLNSGGTSNRSSQRHPVLLPAASLIGFGVGLVAGIAAHKSGDGASAAALSFLAPIGTIWLNALQMCVLPMMASHLALSIASPNSAKSGKMGSITFACFFVLLTLGALLSVGVGSRIVNHISIDQDTLASLRATATNADIAAEVRSGPLSLGRWFLGLVPANIFKAAVDGDVLPLIVATLLLSVAVRKIESGRRQLLLEIIRAVAETTLAFARYLFWILPVAVFILAFEVSARTGPFIAGGVGYLVIILCGLLIAFTLIQYVLAFLFGGVSLGRFASGVLPAQTAAVATRSSLACLPPLLDGARNRIGISPAAVNFVLPLSVSIFKVSRTISAPLNLLFLAHIYGVTMEPFRLLFFIFVTMILSFGTPGIPSGGTMTQLPLYLAAGVPIEGVVLVKAFDAIPDVFKTILNVTANMTTTVLVARFARERAGAVECAKPGLKSVMKAE